MSMRYRGLGLIDENGCVSSCNAAGPTSGFDSPKDAARYLFKQFGGIVAIVVESDYKINLINKGDV